MAPSDSHSRNNPQNRGQVLWTGIVAVALALVGLQHAASSGSNSAALLSRDGVVESAATQLPGTAAPTPADQGLQTAFIQERETTVSTETPARESGRKVAGLRSRKAALPR